MPLLRAHVYVSGRVQGVSFRYSTYHQARRAGVGGWVRNLSDGRVEALFEGDAEAVRRLVERCRRGPPGAFVEDIAVEWGEAAGTFRTFTIEPTPWE